MCGRAARRQQERDTGLIGGRDADVLHFAGGVLYDPAAFVECEFAVDFVPCLFRQEACAVGAAFFIGLRDENDVARQWALLAGDIEYGLGEDGEAAFEIDGAAAVHVAVLDYAGEGIERPLFALYSHHVLMGGDEERLLASVAAQTSNEMGLAGLRSGDDVDLKA